MPFEYPIRKLVYGHQAIVEAILALQQQADTAYLSARTRDGTVLGWYIPPRGRWFQPVDTRQLYFAFQARGEPSRLDAVYAEHGHLEVVTTDFCLQVSGIHSPHPSDIVALAVHGRQRGPSGEPEVAVRNGHTFTLRRA